MRSLHDQRSSPCAPSGPCASAAKPDSDAGGGTLTLGVAVPKRACASGRCEHNNSLTDPFGGLDARWR